MNKMLILLMLVVFMAVGTLLFYSGESAPPAPVARTQDTPEETQAPAPLTDEDRDTYANTIKTMNARNNELLIRLEEMEKRLAEKEQREIKDQDVERLVSQRVEERARNLTSTFTEKLNQFKGDLNTRLRNRPAGKPTAGESDIPAGLGFDGLSGFLPLSGKGQSSRMPTPGTVTILPVAMVGTEGEGESIPVAIDGTPLPGHEPRTRSGLIQVNNQSAKPTRAEPVPVFTVPQNATLFSNDTLTALVGIVPNLEGSVIDPIRFKVITGSPNMATNGQYLPAGIRNIVWSGIAIGNREMSCVRGELHSVTFTFEDGTIRTINSQADAGKNRLGGRLLGYIATQKGNPCLPGKLITNAQDYLTDRMFASGVSAAADGFSDTQTTTQQTTDGTLTRYFSGDSSQYIAAKTLGGSLAELTDYLRERQRQAVDLVYLDAGQDVVLHVETELQIDYDPEGRKLDHANAITPNQLSYRLD